MNHKELEAEASNLFATTYLSEVARGLAHNNARTRARRELERFLPPGVAGMICNQTLSWTMTQPVGHPQSFHNPSNAIKRLTTSIRRMVKLYPEAAEVLDRWSAKYDHTEPTPTRPMAISQAPASPEPDPFFSTYLRGN